MRAPTVVTLTLTPLAVAPAARQQFGHGNGSALPIDDTGLQVVDDRATIENLD